jgi:hypothetical protein
MPRPSKGTINLDIRDSPPDWVVLYDDTWSPDGGRPG